MFCTKGRGNAACKADDWNEELSQETCSFWRPFSLEFSSTSREKEFRNVTYPAWHVQDFVAYIIILVAGPMAVHTASEILPFYYVGIVVSMHFVVPPMQVYLFIKRKQAFVKYRDVSVVFVRLIILLAFIGIGLFAEVPEASVTAIIGAFLTRSPVANMIFSSLAHRVEFKRHVMIHSLAFLESLLWIPIFHQTCATDADVHNTFSKIGYGIDWFFSYTFLNTPPDPASYPCWMISATIMATLGFCLPTLLVFMAEVSARAMFVKSRVSPKAHFALYAYMSEAFKIGILAFVVVIVGTWFLLTHAAKLLR